MRQIDADELKKNFQDELCKGIACDECSMQAEGFCRVERWIDIAPTIEAEPVKHGRWIDVEPAPWGQVYETCSECGIRQTLDKGKDKFCGVCGARMDLTE